jgi:hypothetical protein
VQKSKPIRLALIIVQFMPGHEPFQALCDTDGRKGGVYSAWRSQFTAYR